MRTERSPPRAMRPAGASTWIVARPIRHWPGLAITAKDVWTHLWTLAGGRPGTITATSAGVADAVGIEDRAARRAIDMLVAMSAVERVDRDGRRGVQTLYLEDPEELRRARRLGCGDEQQREMFGGETEAPPPSPPPVVRLAYPPRPRLQRSNEPAEIGNDIAAAIDAATGPDTGRRRKADLVAYIIEAVADSKMDRSIPERAAAAVVDHGLRLDELERVVEATRGKRLGGGITASPGAYFLARMRKLCKATGTPWDT